MNRLAIIIALIAIAISLIHIALMLPIYLAR